ncbi:PAS domain-containing protein [Leeia sp. TBRC 13508]|uniref:PAS domain-containing protein n=1 Tax=Leeia speluncae TaxID=2884804 RepID=A0ABS8D1P0_9NEIS|nr:PAS domain-containing protein [Leeia speluncae]MCB6182109.1 PAS domain-containing protein [Leeia speluncae]
MANQHHELIRAILSAGATLGLGVVCQSLNGELLGTNSLANEWFNQHINALCGISECETGLVITDELGRSLDKSILPSVRCRRQLQDQPGKLIAIIDDGATPFWYEITASLRELADEKCSRIVVLTIRPVTPLVAENTRLHGSHLLAMASTDAVLLLDGNGMVCIANPACDRLFWQPSPTMLGIHLAELWPDKQGWPAVESSILLTLEGTPQHLVTWSEIGRLGWRCIDIRMAPSFNMLGEIDGVLISIRDISESTQKLRMMAQIQSMTKIGTWMLFPSLDNGYWDEMSYQLHGLDADSIVPSLVCADLFYEKLNADAYCQAVKRCFADGTPFSLDLRLIQHVVEGHWLRVTGTAEWRDGKVQKVIGTFQEITDLRSQNEQLSLAAILFETISDPVAIADADQMIVAVNPCFERETGLSADDILGRMIEEVSQAIVAKKPMLSRPKIRAVNDAKGRLAHHIVVW